MTLHCIPRLKKHTRRIKNGLRRRRSDGWAPEKGVWVKKATASLERDVLFFWASLLSLVLLSMVN